ncbi:MULTISPECIES: chaperone NapD [unclassified Rhizobium]|uniref:chaperone NapD n=1 Tax=unclassified Rhizobium TaxID=2613769 RepID=UPI001ADD551D|nr:MULTISPECIES: chaperone NapD [unclassified Rhizobium]MBO9126986.1 chaperone NapD [Rhizobium sp. 16-488-2b]MBO9177433.1 chaperone NapD [Rhizobium sp. 16-488-2a]
MPNRATRHHISSAVVATMPAFTASVGDALANMASVEVHGVENGKFIIVLEGSSTGELGTALTSISLLEGVIAANMVFEHVEEETHDDERRVQEA